MLESRELIRSRLVREAARQWGYRESEMDSTAFDPLVDLLMGSLATELEKINHEIESSRGRVLERMVQMLTPEVSTGPQPAHGVLSAQPVDATFVASPDLGFYCKSPETNKEVNFSVAGHFALTHATVQMAVVGNKIFKVRPTGEKDAMMDAAPGRQLPAYEYWLGLQVNQEVKTIENFSLFFDWRNHPNRFAFLPFVAETQVFLDEQPLEIRHGLIPLKNPSEASSSLSTRLENDVQHLYDPYFVTINGRNKNDGRVYPLTENRKKYPDAFKRLFDGTTQLDALFQQELVWLKIQFPESLPVEAIQKTDITPNAFPVLNRKLNRLSRRPQQFFNVFPLEAEGNFLDLIDVTDGSNNQLRPAQEQDLRDEAAGVYALRQMGVGRFDRRDAFEMINYFMGLVRDESAAFVAMGYDSLFANIDDISRSLTKIKVNLKKDDRDSVPFLMIQAKTDSVAFRFWTTQGEIANRIAPGTKFDSDQPTSIRQESMTLLLPTAGGRRKLQPDESLPLFKQALLTRGRAVTAEDIRTICFAQLGAKLSDVEIKKGVMVGTGKQEGVIRTLDVVLSPNRREGVSNDRWQEMMFELQHLLTQQSSGVLPIRVSIK